MKNTVVVMAMLLFIFTGAVVVPAASAATPSPTPKAEYNLPNRLAKAKEVAKKHVARREAALKKLRQTLSARSSKLLKADAASVETMLNDMQGKLTAWRKAINEATTIEQLKALHEAAFKDTRFFAVFQKKVTWLMRMSIMEKHMARAQKRADNQDNTLKTKRNNTANEKYEQATKRLEEAKAKLSDSKSTVADIKAKVLSFMPADYNANPTDVKNKAKEYSEKLSDANRKTTNAFKILNEVADRLKKISNAPSASPTP